MRKRKKPWKEAVKRTRSLLYLLNKLIELQGKIEDQHRIWITFIEYLDFDPFNEGIRLRNSIWYARTLLGKITHFLSR